MADTFNDILADADDEIIDGLGETVTVKDTGGTSVGSVAGVFDEQFVEAANIQGVMPTFTYLDSDLTGIVPDYTITRNSTDYNVRYRQPDGMGMVMLILGEND